MIIEYVQEALRRAKVRRIDDSEPYYAEVPGLRGVWAKGRTAQECRQRLVDVIDGWIILRLGRGMEIPPLGHYRIQPPKKLRVRG